MTSRDGKKTRKDDGSSSHGDQRTSGASYRELLPIGSGGSAKISIAIAEGVAGFSKLVVLKQIREELAANAAATKMFLDEARLSARMNHPNVVQVYEVYLRQDVPVIVMEFLDGQPLSTILARAHGSKNLTLDVAASILSKVLAGLHYAHTLADFSGEPLGLIHRDVSPHNVMVTYDGQVKLVDFGIAKLARSEHQTRTGVVKGKLTYMAPEQFTGKADCRADIFSIGVMLWEIATHQRYWGSLPEPALIGRLIAGDLPHLRKPAGIDEELYRICCRALAFSRDDRYENAALMQEELERYLARRGALVTQLGVGQLVAEACGEARRKVQAAIRDQLSQQGISLSTHLEAASDRAREREAVSGEHLRPRPGSGKAPIGFAGEQAPGGIVFTGAAPTMVANTGRTTAETPTGGLQKQKKLATEHTPTGKGARARSDQGLPNSSGRAQGSVQAEDAPLRLGGGVAPTARLGMALAGFGTLAVLILALGLATPEDPAAATPAPAPSAQPNAPRRPAHIKLRASAEPASASWYWDDQKLDSNPIELLLPSDGARHTLRAEAPGHKPLIKSVRLEADIDMTVVLTPE